MRSEAILAIRQFYSEEWELYKKLRLDSLIESPDAFGSTFTGENCRQNFEWKQRFHTGINSATDMPLLAEYDCQYSGLLWGKSDKDNIRVANLYQMWVNPKFRGQGVGLALLENIRHWACSIGCHSLQLSVAINNGRAYHFYKAFGFKDFGDTEPLRVGSHIEIQPMKLELDNA